MEDKYAYLSIGVFFVLVLAGFLAFRKGFTSRALKFGLLGGIFGLVAEFFYFRDYWRPPSLMGTAHISFEDFLFGFGIAALGVTIYPVIAKRRMEGGEKRRVNLVVWLFSAGFVNLLVTNLWLGVNSIFVSSFGFLAVASVMVWLRRDLLRPALATGAILTLLSLVLYAPLFNIWAYGFHEYWLMDGTGPGTTIANIPLTEFLWYFAWGSLAGIIYPFASGKRFTAVK